MREELPLVTGVVGLKDAPKRPDGMALVAVMHCQAYVLCWQGNEQIRGLVGSMGYTAEQTGCSLHEITTDDDEMQVENGVYIVELAEEDLGPGDSYDGSHEFGVTVVNAREVTKEEWKAQAFEVLGMRAI